MKFIKLSSILPVESYKQEAKELVEHISGRADLPEKCQVPYLDDKKGDFIITKNGFPVTGYCLPEDFSVGSTSPAIPLYLGLYSLVLLATMVLGGIGLSKFALVIQLAYFFGMVSFFGLWRTFLFLVVTTSLSTAYYMVTRFLPLPEQFNVILTFSGVIPCFIPVFTWAWLSRRRARQLVRQAERANGAAQNAPKSKKDDGRFKQHANCKADTSPRVKLGTATGTLTSYGDSYAPDMGLEMGMSINDLSTHFMVFGPTGSGKTSSVIRPLIQQIINAEKGE